jgi:peptide/nickel transport system substrate-binding protein
LRISGKFVATVIAFGLLAAGCTSGGGSSGGTTAPGPVTTDGGSIVIGAEQEPDCADWIAGCATSIWGRYLMDVPTIPRAFVPQRAGDAWVPVPSELLAGDPEVAPGPPQTVTYHINPAAVWSDGQPISSEDFRYTALATRDGGDIIDKTGYTAIADIATPDAKTAVVTFRSPYADWKRLFSVRGVLPSHLLEGKDRHALMKDGYQWSGGPWRIESWTKGQSVVLVPNERYWGEKPKLDRVTFQFTADTAAAFQAFRTGQLDALYPTPQLDSADQIAGGLANANSLIDPRSGNLEGIWFNNARAPFDSVAFRTAVSYAVDRNAIVTRLYGGLGQTAPAQSVLTPVVGEYASDAFARYTPDQARTDALMQGDGWTRGADGIWAKESVRAAFTVSTMAGNKRRELTEQILQQQLRTAGFEVTVDNTSSTELFGTKLPQGDFQMGVWTLVDTFPVPALQASFSSAAIPNAGNNFSGLNVSRITAPGLDEKLTALATSLDENERVALTREIDGMLADAAAVLPLSTIPNILLTSKKIGGPLSIDPIRGPFWNLAQWGLTG